MKFKKVERKIKIRKGFKGAGEPSTAAISLLAGVLAGDFFSQNLFIPFGNRASHGRMSDTFGRVQSQYQRSEGW